MTNLPAFLALLRRELGGVAALLYMHENQLTYPVPPGSKRDLTYGMMQHLSMLAADAVRFNSAYHMRSWFDELPRLLKHFPDYTHLESIEAARAKSAVLPVGCDLRRLDRYRDAAAARSEPPLILWNQRWEYDKDPETMLRALYALAGRGAAVSGSRWRARASACSRPSSRRPATRLGDRLVHYGYAESEADYARLLWSADVVLSTAIHEFFGVSVVEAIYCGARPVLPRRLSYPELLPAELHADVPVRRFRGAVGAPARSPAGEARRGSSRRLCGSRDRAQFDWSRFRRPSTTPLLLSMA